MNEDIVPVHDAIIGPFIATAVSKLFSSRFFGLHKGAALVLPLSPPAGFNSDTAKLILLLANDPHQDANVDARESFVSSSMQPCHGSELCSRGWWAAHGGVGTSGMLSSITRFLQAPERGRVKYICIFIYMYSWASIPFRFFSPPSREEECCLY